MKSVLLMLDASGSFVLFALPACKPSRCCFYLSPLFSVIPVIRSWRILTGETKGKIRLRELLTQGEGWELQENILLPCGCLESLRAGFILLVSLILLSVRLSLWIKDELPSSWSMMLLPNPWLLSNPP